MARSGLPSPERSSPTKEIGVRPNGVTGRPNFPHAAHPPATQLWPPGQTMGFSPRHMPAWQVSVWVQASPSSHAVPFAAGLLTGTPFSQTSSVHGLLSSTGTHGAPVDVVPDALP